MTVAVVGGGLAGLSAATEAAGSGADVVLYDARETLGGRARTRDRDGFLLNEGAHALYVDGEAMAFLREFGREPSGGVPDADAGIGVDGALSGPLPAGVWSLLRSPLLRGDRLGFARLFARLARLRPADYCGVTVDDALHDLLGEGPAARLGHALFRLSTYGNDPSVASADAGLVQLQYGLDHGVRYLDGGWQTIVATLRSEAARRGVRFETGPQAKVSRVSAVDEGVQLVVGDVVRSHVGAVLAPGAPRHVAKLLGDRVPEAAGWAAAARPAAVASLDVGLGVEWGRAAPFALGVDEPLYLSVHAPVARLAPSGRALVHVSRYLHPDETPDADRDRAACERLLDRVRPGWRQHAAHVGFHPRLLAATDQPRAANGGLGGRPGSEVPGLRHVYLAGDWVGPVGVLADASVSSGRAAGRLAACRS